MTHSIRIRELCDADLSIVRAWMREEPSAPSWSEDDLARLVTRSSAPDSSTRRTRHAWMAEDAAEHPAGFAVVAALQLEDAAAECELEFLFVTPRARRLGIASMLLQSILQWARAMRAQEIWLEVRASNAAAIALYTNIGFAPVGRRPGYYTDPPEDALLMRRTIAAPV